MALQDDDGSNPISTIIHSSDPINTIIHNIPIDPPQDDEVGLKAVAKPELQHVHSHISHHDMHATDSPSNLVDESIYDRLSSQRKIVAVTILSFCGFLAPISSTTVLSAVPEVADQYSTTGTIINLSNALYLIFMGISPCLWGPISQVYGRRWICIISALLFFAFSIGTALAPNLVAFFIFRILTAFQGTAFLIVGASCIGDMYKPVERATALGFFLSGALVGPAFGPFIGGIIVTFRSWRDIFWLQAALGGLATGLTFAFLPETIHYRKSVELHELSKAQQARKLWQWTNPIRVVKLYRYPNLFIAGLASSSLTWNMYSLLTPIRYVLNPRFHLTSPTQSGLFYIAPGCGYLLGSFFGGRHADMVVKRWIKKRNGERVSEDRLRSCLPFLGIIIPGCMLIYGWSVEKAKGGIPTVVIFMFLQGVAQLFCFPSLNTYCLDVMQSRSSEVVAGNYMIRYFFAAVGTAVCLPGIERIGVGWFTVVSSAFLVASTIMVWATTIWGRKWRDNVDARLGKNKREVNVEKGKQVENGR